MIILLHIFEMVKRICRRSLRRLNCPVIPRVANGSLASFRSLNRFAPCSLRLTGISRSKPGRTDAWSTCLSPHTYLVFWFGLLRRWGLLSWTRWLGLVGEAGGKYEAGPEWWWSWSRPVIEANRERWGTRCNHRHPVDMKKAWDCLRPSLWLYYRRQRTECWIWKRWACSSKPFVVS